MLILVREFLLLAVAAVFQYSLLKSRFSRAKTLAVLISGVFIVYIVGALLFLPENHLLYKKLYPLTVNLPVFLLFIYVSKYKGFKILFNLLTTTFLCFLMSICGYLFSMLFDYSLTANFIGWIAAFPLLLLFVVKVFRPLYLQMLDNLKKGWALFCIIPLLSFFLLYNLSINSAFLTEQRQLIVPLLLASALTIIVYGVICVFFHETQQQFALQSEQRLLKAQVSALQNQSDAVKEIEAKTSIQHHDMRHYLQNIAALVKTGETDAAMEFIEKIDDVFKQTALPKFCENTTINAILAYYLESIKKEGIQIDTRLDIPQKTPMDEIELSTVFANAIENARNACRKLPPGTAGSIKVVCVSKPHFAFEIANTYCGEIAFDHKGRPVSLEDEHGVGTQSIAAFAKKHNALLDYKTDNGVFRLRILLPQS